MIDPPKGPSKDGSGRFKTVVAHLGPVDMRPSVRGDQWPPPDAEALSSVMRIVQTANRRAERPASLSAKKGT
jgi:hypothetical protein